MSSSNQRAQQKHLINFLRPQQVVTPPPVYQATAMAHLGLQAPIHDTSDDEDDEDDDGHHLAALRIRIHTPLLITGDNNLISTDMGASAGKTSLAVITALKQICGEDSGVPMIDGDGAPRPIDITVMAEIKIEGSHNVVGEKAVLARASAVGETKKLDVVEQNGQGVKRERVGSEPLEVDPKRVRRD